MKFYYLEEKWGDDCVWNDLEECERKDAEYVGIGDFDAERLRADTAEAELKDVEDDLDTVTHHNIDLQLAAKAAEQRIAELDSRNKRLEMLLRRASNYGGLTPNWHDAVQFILAEQKDSRSALSTASPATINQQREE